MAVNVKVTATIDRSALQRWFGIVPPKAIEKASGRVRDMAKAQITAAGRIDTGTMRNTITAETVRRFGQLQVIGRVTAPVDYAVYQHEGTANNGAGFIYPRRAKALRFRPKGATSFVFAKRVRGVKGVPFLTDSLKRLTPADFT